MEPTCSPTGPLGSFIDVVFFSHIPSLSSVHLSCTNPVRCAVHIGESIWFLGVLFQFLKTDAIRTGDTTFYQNVFSVLQGAQRIFHSPPLHVWNLSLGQTVTQSNLHMFATYSKQNTLVIIFDSFSTYHKAKSLQFENKVTSKEPSLM